MPTFFSQISKYPANGMSPHQHFYFGLDALDNPAHSMTPEGILTFVEISID